MFSYHCFIQPRTKRTKHIPSITYPRIIKKASLGSEWRVAKGWTGSQLFPCISVFFLFSSVFSSVFSSLFAFFFLFAPYYLPSQRTVHSDRLIQPRAGQSKLPLCCSCQNYPPLPSAHRKHCVRRVVRRAARTSSLSRPHALFFKFTHAFFLSFFSFFSSIQPRTSPSKLERWVFELENEQAVQPARDAAGTPAAFQAASSTSSLTTSCAFLQVYSRFLSFFLLFFLFDTAENEPFKVRALGS